MAAGVRCLSCGQELIWVRKFFTGEYGLAEKPTVDRDWPRFKCPATHLHPEANLPHVVDIPSKLDRNSIESWLSTP